MSLPKKRKMSKGDKSYCVAWGCEKKRRTIKDSDYVRSDSDGDPDDQSDEKKKHPRTFHRFPENAELRRKWLIALNRADLRVNLSSSVCSDHFRENQLVRGQKTFVKPGECPSRFKMLKRKTKKASQAIPSTKETAAETSASNLAGKELLAKEFLEALKQLRAEGRVINSTKNDPISAVHVPSANSAIAVDNARSVVQNLNVTGVEIGPQGVELNLAVQNIQSGKDFDSHGQEAPKSQTPNLIIPIKLMSAEPTSSITKTTKKSGSATQKSSSVNKGNIRKENDLGSRGQEVPKSQTPNLVLPIKQEPSYSLVELMSAEPTSSTTKITKKSGSATQESSSVNKGTISKEDDLGLRNKHVSQTVSASHSTVTDVNSATKDTSSGEGNTSTTSGSKDQDSNLFVDESNVSAAGFGDVIKVGDRYFQVIKVTVAKKNVDLFTRGTPHAVLSTDIKDSSSGKTVKGYRCSMCPGVFHKLSKLNKHLLDHFKSRDMKRWRKTRYTGLPCKCTLCKKEFRSYPVLISHQRALHSEAGCISCRVCGQVFSTVGALRTHLAVHTERKKYTCDVCNRVFVARKPFLLHKAEHNESTLRPYSCETCGKSFTQHGKLRLHEQFHLAPRFPCQLCDKMFNSRTGRSAHEKACARIIERRKEYEARMEGRS